MPPPSLPFIAACHTAATLPPRTRRATAHYAVACALPQRAFALCITMTFSIAYAYHASSQLYAYALPRQTSAGWYGVLRDVGRLSLILSIAFMDETCLGGLYLYARGCAAFTAGDGYAGTAARRHAFRGWFAHSVRAIHRTRLMPAIRVAHALSRADARSGGFGNVVLPFRTRALTHRRAPPVTRTAHDRAALLPAAFIPYRCGVPWLTQQAPSCDFVPRAWRRYPPA